jgi:hypothetical protein
MTVQGTVVLIAFGVLGALYWLLAPLWSRPRVEAPPIPPAAVAGRVDFGARRPRRALTTGEAIRVSAGIVGLCLFAGVVAYVFQLATAGFDFHN